MKNTDIYHIVFYISLILTIILSLTVTKENLIYTVPLVMFSVLLLYLKGAKKNTSILFIIAVSASLTSTLLALYNFNQFFNWIAICTALYLIILALLLKKYLKKSKLKSFLKADILISFMFLAYIFYIVLGILKASVSIEQLFISVVCALSLIVFMVTISVIYINDIYNKRITLLLSGILIFCQITLSNINEFIYFNKVTTMLILLCNYIGIYLFMRFILDSKVLKDDEILKKFI